MSGPQECSLYIPFFGRNLPYLLQESPRDIVTLFDSNHAHSSLLRDASRSDIQHRLGSAQDGEAKHLEPIVIEGDHRLSHQTSTLPGEPQPEFSIAPPFPR